MTRKLWVFATAALFSATAVMAGLSHTRNAAACDKTSKSAAASTSSCCAKDGAKTASTDAKKVHNSMIKSAVVAPGAAPILNVAAFAGALGSGNSSDCDWCPDCPEMSAAGCANKMSAEECERAMAAGCPAMKGAATTASYEGCPHAATASVASTNGGCSHATASVASGNGECSHASVAMAAGSGCQSGAVKTAAGSSCCKGEATSTAAKNEKCSTAKTASLKDVVDDLPYAENRRISLAGAYACGHCTLGKTDACAPMLKTADGQVYPLLRTNQAKKLHSVEGKNIEVTGNVKRINGVKYLDVKSYKVI